MDLTEPVMGRALFHSQGPQNGTDHRGICRTIDMNCWVWGKNAPILFDKFMTMMRI